MLSENLPPARAKKRRFYHLYRIKLLRQASQQVHPGLVPFLMGLNYMTT